MLGYLGYVFHLSISFNSGPERSLLVSTHFFSDNFLAMSFNRL